MKYKNIFYIKNVYKELADATWKNKYKEMEGIDS